MVVSRVVLLSFLVTGASAFAPLQPARTTTLETSTTLFEYIPSGLSKAEWEKIKSKDRAKKEGLGRLGPRGFKSRSFQSFQEALERGEASHLMPVFNAKEKIRRGELREEDIPYMQRGGAWVSCSEACFLQESRTYFGLSYTRWLPSFYIRTTRT